MKSSWLSALFAWLWLAAAASAATPAAVAYQLSPELGPDGLSALKVEIRLAGDASGRTRIAFLKSWAGDDQLWTRARDLTVEGGAASPDGPGAWIVAARPGAPLTVRYRVVSAYDHDPTVNDSRQSKPVIRPTWFYAVGEGLFAAPDGRDAAPASFVWTGAPRGFGFASDLEHLGGPGRKGLRPGTVHDVQESIVIGGRDLRLTARRIDGAPVRVATVGRYAFDPAGLEAQVFEVLKAERAFWGDRAQPFLVTLSPLAPVPRSRSYGGTGRGDAFALWVDPDTQLADLRWLLAHEYFHTWNPMALGGMGDDQVEAAEYWFSEGFTDYYAWKLMLRAGLFSPAEFAARWNDTLRAYAASPLRDAPNSRILADFWTSWAARGLPYQRGALLAATLDARARQRGGSLDAVMREMRRRAAAPGTKLHADELFPIVYRQITGLDAADLIARHMVAGAPLLLAPDALGACFRIETHEVPAFARGWDAEATRKAGDVVTGLEPDSPAYAAGLREGMKIVGYDFIEGDPTHDVVLKVKPAQGIEQTVRFLPVGKARLTEQQVTLAEPAARPADCAA